MDRAETRASRVGTPRGAYRSARMIYPDDTLRDWADWLAGEIASGRTAYAYFNNDAQAHAVCNAQTLRDMLAERIGA